MIEIVIIVLQIIDGVIDSGVSVKWEDDGFVLDINWLFSLNLHRHKQHLDPLALVWGIRNSF